MKIACFPPNSPFIIHPSTFLVLTCPISYSAVKYKTILAARAACAAGTATEEQLKLAPQPLASGAIESTCRQDQCRFKRTGQFWTTVGDEALLCVETFWRNGRWHELYPHAKTTAALN